jgi:YbbR domain-containing protein
MTTPSRYSIFRNRYLIGVMLFALVGIGGSLLIPYFFIREADIFLPIATENVPKGLIVTSMPVKGMEVRVRGLKSAIRVLPRRKIHYTMDLSKVHVGVNTIMVRKDRVPLPEGISILKINPSVFRVKVEKEIRKNLPVHVSLIGKPADGFAVVRTKTQPATVTLGGSITTLGPMDEVSTKHININGLSGSFKKKVALNLKENLRLVDSSDLILAHVVIRERIVDKTFNHLPVIGKQTPYAYRITPPTITIRVRGPSNLVGKLSEDKEIQAYIDLQGLKPGKHKKRATITLPVKITLIDAKPEIFEITIAKQKTNR